jgi:PEGA domain-containing protein
VTQRNRVWVVVFILLTALSSPHGWPVAAAERSGELRVESDPAGATVYVDGHPAGQTPLTVATLAPGVHRVRLIRTGYLENSRLVTIKGGTRAAVRAQLTAAAPPLKIVVVEGEGAVNIIQQKTAVAPVVEVRDRNDQPVSGAVVRFAIQKGRATFNGARMLTATTDALGRATATGLTPIGNGPVQIGASAAFQGQTAAITIAQTNVLTAAQASSVAAGGSGTAGGGGGLSHLAIAGIVGGAGAGIGGALIASKASRESDSDRCALSPVCGRWDVFFNNPGLDVSACGLIIPGLGFSSQGFNADLSGVFHEVWSTSTPVVQVDGTLTPAGLSATLRCLSTAATGTISATPSGPDYLGTATLSGTTASIRVSRRPQGQP